LYGSESWTLKRKDENMLRSFERKILRRMYVRTEEIWRDMEINVKPLTLYVL
jgi:hypothetical protein